MYARIVFVTVLVFVLAVVSGCLPTKKSKDCPPRCKNCVQITLDEDCQPEDAAGNYLDTAEVDQGDCLCFENKSESDVITVKFDSRSGRRPIQDSSEELEPGERWCPKIKNNVSDGYYFYNVKCERGGGSDGPKVKVGGGG